MQDCGVDWGQRGFRLYQIWGDFCAVFCRCLDPPTLSASFSSAQDCISGAEVCRGGDFELALGFLRWGDVCRAVPQASGGAASGCGQPLTAYEATVLTSMKLEAPLTRGTQKPQPPGFASMCDCDRETKDPCVCPLPVFPPVLPDQTTGRPRHSAAGLPALAAAGTSRRCPGGSRTASMRARSPSRRRNALLPKRADFGFLLGGAAHCSFLSCGWAAQTLVCAWLVVISWGQPGHLMKKN